MGIVRHTRRNWLKLDSALPLQHKPNTTMTGLGTRLAENEKVIGSGTGMRTEVVQSWSGNEAHTRKLRYSFHRSVLRQWCASARRKRVLRNIRSSLVDLAWEM